MKLGFKQYDKYKTLLSIISINHCVFSNIKYIFFILHGTLLPSKNI